MNVGQGNLNTHDTQNFSREEVHPVGYGLLNRELVIIDSGSLPDVLPDFNAGALMGISILEIFPQLDSIKEKLVKLGRPPLDRQDERIPVVYSMDTQTENKYFFRFDAIPSIQGIIMLLADLGKYVPIEVRYLEVQNELKDIQDKFQQQVSYYENIEEQLFESSVNLMQTQEGFSDRVARLEALHTISVALSSTRETKALLQLIVEQAAMLLNADSCSVALLDPESGDLVFQAAVDDIVGKRIPKGQGIMFRSLRKGSAQVVHDVRFDPDHYTRTGEESNLRARSILAVPLRTSDQGNIGVLAVVNRRETWFSNEDRDLLVTMASYAAIALDNIHLFEQVQNQARELEKKVVERTAELNILYQRQAALAEIELSINQQYELEKVNEKIVEHTRQLLTPNGEAVLILWDKNKHAYFSGASTSRKFPLDKILARLEEENEIAQWITQHRKPIVEQDLQNPVIISPDTNSIILDAGIISLAGAPLYAESEALGVLYALDCKARQFIKEDLDFLMALANRAANSIVKVRLYESERTQRVEAETLREAGAIVAETLNQSEAIERILLQLARVIPYDSACVQLLRNGYLEIVGGRGWADEKMVLGFRFPIPANNPNTVVVQERRTLLLSDAKGSYSPFREDPHTHIESWLGVPLIVHDTVIGMLALDSSTINYFTERHAELAMAFADQVAVAIENARLFETTKRNEMEAKTVRDILHRLNSVPDLIEAFPAVTNGLRELTKCTRISLALLSDDKTSFTMVALDQPGPELSKGTTLPVIATSSAEDVLAGRIHITPDLAEELHSPAEKLLYDAGHRSRINIPLQTPTGIIGALNLTWQNVNGILPYQIPILSQVADSIALAVQKERLFQEVQTLATIDELTGLFNRRRLFELGRIEFEKARRYSIPLSALMIDIDHFKQVNDTYGHTTGDQVMQILAQRCQQVIRTTDVFGRYGGEEFTILLPHTAKVDALKLAERLRQNIGKKPFYTDRGEIPITISLGVSDLTDNIVDLASLIDRADTALLAAKHSGRNRIEDYLP